MERGGALTLLPFGFEEAVAFEPENVGALSLGRRPRRARLLVLPEVAAKGGVAGFERCVLSGFLGGGGFGLLGLRRRVVLDRLLPPAVQGGLLRLRVRLRSGSSAQLPPSPVSACLLSSSYRL